MTDDLRDWRSTVDLAATESLEHICLFSENLIWGDWIESPDSELERRFARRVPVCPQCGRQRKALRPRPHVRREVRPGIVSHQLSNRT